MTYIAFDHGDHFLVCREAGNGWVRIGCATSMDDAEKLSSELNRLDQVLKKNKKDFRKILSRRIRDAIQKTIEDYLS